MKKRTAEQIAEGEVQVAVRLSNELVKKLDAEKDRLAQLFGLKMTRTNLIRMIITKHFEPKGEEKRSES